MLRRFFISASHRSRKDGRIRAAAILQNDSRRSQSVNLFQMMHPMHLMKLPPLHCRERTQNWMIEQSAACPKLLLASRHDFIHPRNLGPNLGQHLVRRHSTWTDSNCSNPSLPSSANCTNRCQSTPSLRRRMYRKRILAPRNYVSTRSPHRVRIHPTLRTKPPSRKEPANPCTNAAI